MHGRGQRLGRLEEHVVPGDGGLVDADGDGAPAGGVGQRPRGWARALEPDRLVEPHRQSAVGQRADALGDGRRDVGRRHPERLGLGRRGVGPQGGAGRGRDALAGVDAVVPVAVLDGHHEERGPAEVLQRERPVRPGLGPVVGQGVQDRRGRRVGQGVRPDGGRHARARLGIADAPGDRGPVDGVARPERERDRLPQGHAAVVLKRGAQGDDVGGGVAELGQRDLDLAPAHRHLGRRPAGGRDGHGRGAGGVQALGERQRDRPAGDVGRAVGGRRRLQRRRRRVGGAAGGGGGRGAAGRQDGQEQAQPRPHGSSDKNERSCQPSPSSQNTAR